MYRLIIYFYIFISFFISYGIIRLVKPKNWIICFITTYWFTITPVVRSRLFLSINPFSHITGNPWRIEWHITIFLLIIFLLKFLSDKDQKFSLNLMQMPLYEKFFYIYIILSAIITEYHINSGNMPERLRSIQLFYHYQALLFFFLLTRLLDKDFIKCILYAAIYMSILSTIISPIQFYIDSNIMRTDRTPWAFGEHNRSSGLFQYGDQHAFIATVAMFYFLFKLKNILAKVLILIFYSYGIIFTFARGVWITFLCVIILHFYLIERKYFYKTLKYGFMPALILYFLLQPYLPDISVYIEGNDAIEDRVLSDTFTPRMEYNLIVFNTIADRWVMGYGSLLDNETYYKMMYALGGKEWAQGMQGGIHNLYLSELFLKGFFVATALALFLLFFMKFTLVKGIKEQNYLYLLAFYYVFSYALYQMTAAAWFTNYAAVMATIFMAIISAVEYNHIDISEFKIIKNKINNEKID